MAHTDLMIDLETLAIGPGAVITQIGLCSFTADRADTTFVTRQIRVDPQSCIDLGMRIDWETIRFWVNAEEGARAEFAKEEKGYEIHRALDEVYMHYKTNHVVETHPKDENGYDLKRVWGHGAAFDIPILEEAWRITKRHNDFVFSPPWTYKMIRDTRTLSELTPNATRVDPRVPHIAAADAEAQARWVVNMFADLQQRLEGR